MTDRVARQSRQRLFKCRLSRSAGPARRLPATHNGSSNMRAITSRYWPRAILAQRLSADMLQKVAALPMPAG
jgi:hypothetical protein